MELRWLRFHLIEWLGGIPLSHHKVRYWKHQEYMKALADVRATIERSDKVFMEPVVMKVEGFPFARFQIDNCVFWGAHKEGSTALKIEG